MIDEKPALRADGSWPAEAILFLLKRCFIGGPALLGWLVLFWLECLGADPLPAELIARSIDTLGSERTDSWKQITRTAPGSMDSRFLIQGKSLRLHADLSALAQYYRRKPPHQYTMRWMRTHILFERNYDRGKSMLASKHIEYGASVIRQVSSLPEPGSGIVSYRTGPAQSYVVGRSLMWRDYVAERRIDYFKPDRWIIRDTVTPTSATLRPPQFAVLFHTPMNKLVQIVNHSKAIIHSTNGHQLVLTAEPSPQHICLVKGNLGNTNSSASWVSTSITQLEPSQCLRFEFAGTNSVTCTLVLAPHRGKDEQSLAE